MTDTGLRPPPQPAAWHRPLLALTVLMGVLTALFAVLALLDPKEVLGQNAWFKPLKFSVSIGIYSLSLAWMIGLLRRFRKTARLLGTVSAIGLAVEIVIIAGAAVSGTTSHFNVSTPLHATLWAAMAVSIVVIWIIALLIAVALAFTPLGDQARDTAMRSAAFLGVVGMAVAFFMTQPTADQLNDFQGIAGAHAVGVADGGPGLPFLGWSTEGGDLRVPHFIGMHALQAIPLFLLALESLARRLPLLGAPRVRFRLVLIAAVGYAGWIILTTWQALMGESVVMPSANTLIGMGVLVGGSILATSAVLLHAALRTDRLRSEAR